MAEKISQNQGNQSTAQNPRDETTSPPPSPNSSSAAAVSIRPKPSFLPPWMRGVGQTYGAAIALVLLLLYNVFFTPYFMTIQTLNINLTQVSTIVIVATGMTLVIATGGIDL